MESRKDPKINPGVVLLMALAPAWGIYIGGWVISHFGLDVSYQGYMQFILFVGLPCYAILVYCVMKKALWL